MFFLLFLLFLLLLLLFLLLLLLLLFLLFLLLKSGGKNGGGSFWRLETLWHGRIFLKGRLGVSLFEAWPYKGERGFIALRSMALWQGMYRSSKHGTINVKGRWVYRSSKLGCRKNPAVNLEQEQQKRCKKNMTGREKAPKEVHPSPVRKWHFECWIHGVGVELLSQKVSNQKIYRVYRFQT